MAGRTDQSGVRASIPVLGEATALILKGLTVALPNQIERGWLPSASARSRTSRIKAKRSASFANTVRRPQARLRAW